MPCSHSEPHQASGLYRHFVCLIAAQFSGGLEIQALEGQQDAHVPFHQSREYPADYMMNRVSCSSALVLFYGQFDPRPGGAGGIVKIRGSV